MVLEDIGVRFSTFTSLQEDTMADTMECTRTMRRFRLLLGALKLGHRFNIHYNLGALVDMNFGFHNDVPPDGSGDEKLLNDYFFFGIVQSVTWAVFRQIKYQARILVPDSWTLVGVLDEHGLLGPGEIMGELRRGVSVIGVDLLKFTSRMKRIPTATS
jgi:RNA-dependent RNA polymerase